MTATQRKARNEAYQLISIAHRILDEAGLIAYASDAENLKRSIECDARMIERQEVARRTA